MLYYPNIEMNEEMALFIKNLRIAEGYSWRSVDKHFQLKYIPESDWWTNPATLRAGFTKLESMGHQLAGMEICDEAMKFLGDCYEDGWN